MTISSKVTYAPNFNTIRIVSANDASLPNAKRKGINLADFKKVILQVALKGGRTAADVEATFWSDEQGAFVRQTGISVAVTASSKRFVIEVNRSASVFFEVTGITGGSGEGVFIELAGDPEYDEVG